MCQDDRVIEMEQLAHREWGAGQRPKGRAGIFQGRRHVALRADAPQKYQILCQLALSASPCVLSATILSHGSQAMIASKNIFPYSTI